MVRFTGVEMEGCPRFPGSHLCLFHCGRSPALSSSGPGQRPLSKNSVPCRSLVQFSLCPCLASSVCALAGTGAGLHLESARPCGCCGERTCK